MDIANPYTRNSISHQKFEQAIAIVRNNDSNGKSTPSRIFEYIRQLSSDSTKSVTECITEWEMDRYLESDTSTYCTCGHDIHHVYIMRNTITGNMMVVGSDCIHKFGSSELNQQARNRAYEYLTNSQRQVIKMKYVDHMRNPDGTYRYRFVIKKKTRLYNILRDFPRETGQWYPWVFNSNNDCIISVKHRYRQQYVAGWQDVPISFSILRSNGKTALYINRRAAV